MNQKTKHGLVLVLIHGTSGGWLTRLKGRRGSTLAFGFDNEVWKPLDVDEFG